MASNAIERITEKGFPNGEEGEVDPNGASALAGASLLCIAVLSMFRSLF